MVQPQETHQPPLRTVMESYVNVTGATYTAKAGDRLIGVNRAGAVTITLPTAQLRAGRTYTLKDESGAAATNNITVATAGSETIDGAATDTIADNHGSKTYYSDGSNWFTIPLLAAASHTLASHSAKAHSDLTGVGTDDHHAQSHTLASHSAKAHSDLTGVGTGDHHTEAHQPAHNSGGADALKLDDLSVPDDNTDLNFSTTAHGLVPKGTNTGNFLKDDGTWAATGGGGGSDISARVTDAGTQSISNATWTMVNFDTELFDTDTIHDNATNNTRLTCKTAGKYLIIACIGWAYNANGDRGTRLRFNATKDIADQYVEGPSNGAASTSTVSTLYDLAVNDYVEVRIYQDSGGALNTVKNEDITPQFMMIKVA